MSHTYPLNEKLVHTLQHFGGKTKKEKGKWTGDLKKRSFSVDEFHVLMS